MTDAYRDAWLSEMWAPVRQHHEYAPRQSAPRTPRKPCPFCPGEYTVSNLSRHVSRMHPQAAGNGAKVVHKVAS